jgi:5-methylcytosine-specific restriction endonuclease McrBC GTP-binding regulatory subunit McrB
LFQLLDRKDGFSEYPIEADEDIQKALLEDDPEDGLSFGNDGLNLSAEQITYINQQYDIVGQPSQKVAEKISQGQVLVLPPNFYIWATMNTSDQSLFPIDSAFKRRWAWKYVRISEGKKKDGTPLNYRIKFTVPAKDEKPKQLVDVPWWDFVRAINKQIEDATKSEDKKLGYFFCKPDKKDNDADECNTIISAETFVGKVVFYLWQDVFKDYGFKSDIFKREDMNIHLLARVSVVLNHDFFAELSEEIFKKESK